MLVIKRENKKFNFRVAAIIQNESNDMILIHRKSNQNFWILPGGRVEMGEDTSKAIKRELIEELNIREEVELKYITENFFELDNIKYHELCFFYKTIINQNKYNMNNEEFYGIEGEQYIFKWVNIEELINYDIRPKFLKEKIKNSNKNIEHIITKK